MPPAALALVILAAVLHATWNIAAKKAGGDDRFVFISTALTSVLWLPMGLWFGWHEVPRWGWAEWGAVAASAAVHLLYFRALITGYRVGDLTVVYPLARGSGPLLTALVEGKAGVKSLSIERPGLHDAFVAIAGEAVAAEMDDADVGEAK
jgi:drug/metabolite transporter (DMT)-like permease